MDSSRMTKCKKGRKIRGFLGGFWVNYTILFGLVCLIVFSWFYAFDRTLILEKDGWMQHYKAMVYYGQYLRDIIRTVFIDHSFAIPSWEFALGEGNDILSALHYYVIGDPFAVLAAAVPTRYMYIYYDAMVILRLYLAGVAFLLLGKELGYKNRFSLYAGALIYVFCMWSLFNVNRHPYFLNPVVYFPLLILGVEKLLHGKKPYIFTLAVFVSALSNFYFFYMLVLLTVIYVIARLVTKYRRNIKNGLKMLGRITIWSALGAAMGAVILLPICWTFLSDMRTGVDSVKHIFYPLSYYSNLATLFFSKNTTYWMCMGFAAPAIFALLMVIRRKSEHSFLKLIFFICLIIMIFPIFGQSLNGFTYIANRWSWAFALPVGMMMVAAWDRLMNLQMKDGRYLLISMTVFFAAAMFLEYARDQEVFAAVGIALLCLIVLLPVRDEKGQLMISYRWKQRLVLLAVICGVANQAFWLYSPEGGDYAATAMDRKHVQQNLNRSEARYILDAAKESGETGFYRYSGTQFEKNSNLLARMSSTQYYWSLSNPAISEYRRVLNYNEPGLFNYLGYDGRASALALSSVKYYVVPAGVEHQVPYGFTYVRSGALKRGSAETGIDIYETSNNLPLAYVYQSGIDRAIWNTLSAIDRQEAMLQAVVLEEEVAGLKQAEIQNSAQTLEYSVKCKDEGVTFQDNCFVVTRKNAAVTLEFEGLENCETYLEILGLDYTGIPQYDLYFGENTVDPLELYGKSEWENLDSETQNSIRKKKVFWSEETDTKLTLTDSNKHSRSVVHNTIENTTYNGKHDYLVNMGYEEKAVTSITVKFTQIGTYRLQEMNVICQPRDQLETQIAALSEYTMENTVIGTDSVKGSINLDQPGMLCFSIPYSSGWSAVVDGADAKLYQANIKNMAVYLEPGIHEIELRYQTPFLKLGWVISIESALVFFGYILINRRKQK